MIPGLSEAGNGPPLREDGEMDAAAARRMAHETFVTDDNTYGCAETSYIVLKHAYGLADPDDSASAMALNGGFAYQGGMCGALSGAALAVGQLASLQIPDHAVAKRVARGLVRAVMDDFDSRFGSTECRDLIGYHLNEPGEHDRFLESGVWRTKCAAQVEFSVGRLAELASPGAWDEAVAELEREG